MPAVHVLTFTINKPFTEWVTFFDASIPAQKVAGITPLFRGVSPDDPTKVCAAMEAEPEAMDQFIKDNEDLIMSSGHVLESTQIAVYSQG
ncbi:MAG: DUF3764 family protein [Prochlorococcus sp.]